VRRLVGLALLLVAGPATSQQPPAQSEPLRLTLKDALERALLANAGVERARAEVGVAEAQRKVALSAVLPRLGATGSMIRNNKEVGFGSGDDRRVILPENDWRSQLTLSQPLFAGLREKRGYDQAKENVVAAGAGVAVSEERVLIRVAEEYLRVAAAEAVLEVEKKTLELARRRQRQAQDLFEAGETTRVDVLRAETAIKAAERRIAEAQRDRQVGVGQLRIDLALDGPLEIDNSGMAVPAVPGEAELLARAEGGRAELQQAKSALRIATLEIQKQKGAYLPVVTADAGYIRQHTNFPTDRYGFAALRFNVPLFQGGEVGARVAQAKQRERQAQLSYEEAQRTVREDVRRALLDAETAATELALAQEQLQASETEYAQVFEQYKNQEATSLDASASEAVLADARRTVAIDRLRRQLAELGVWYSVGGLGAAVREAKEVRP
jgi:outer membrane protein